ncbi:MAG: carbohydrate ABC transporter permease, partial [Spirochaetaceae bacterium]
VFFLLIPMMFSGGLIPTFLVVNAVGLLNSFWSLILPAAVPIFSIIIFMNYVRGLPSALMESATIDGAGHLRIIGAIIVPLSLPSVATLVLFSFVFHWNSWFDGLIYINDIAKWPIQTVLRSFLTGQLDMTTAFDISQLDRITKLSDTGFKAAEVILIMVPLLLIYPLLQRYYIKGLTLGAVKQ